MKSPAIFLPALLPLAVANPFSAQVGIEARIEARNVTDLANEVTGLASNITGLASNVTGVASDLTSLARGKPRRHRHADDRVPDFRKPCQCPEPTCPPMLNAKSVR